MDEFPLSVKAAVERMSEPDKAIFYDEYSRKRKSTGTAYLASLLFLHYAYTGRIGLTAIGWFLSIITGGVVGFVWWLVDLFRIPGIVRDFNASVATTILRDQKIIGMINA